MRFLCIFMCEASRLSGLLSDVAICKLLDPFSTSTTFFLLLVNLHFLKRLIKISSFIFSLYSL